VEISLLKTIIKPSQKINPVFDKAKHIAKMQPAVNKLMAHLKAKGVTFQETDPSGFENIILGYKDKVIKISHHSFYRYSGIACVYKETEALKKSKHR
jgi:hypothetical protein